MTVIKWAIIMARNEAEDIRGWVKTAQYFAKKQVVVIDPASTDTTEQILTKEFPSVQILWQDRYLGDSDNKILGKDRVMICHKNLEKTVNELMTDGEWVLLLAPDERFDPTQWNAIAQMVKTVKRHQLANGITFPSIHTFLTEDRCIDYWSKFKWGHIIQLKFMRKNGYWHKGGPPHSGYDIPYPLFWSGYPMYHYCWLKQSRQQFQTWRDQKQYQQYSTYFLPNPIPNWRDLT